MALDERYFVTSDLSPYFVDKNSGLPLANGSISFYRDVARNTPKTVYQLIGAPPNYGYVPLPNPVPLSSVGQPQDGNNNNVIIYYFPYDSDGNLDLYYAVVKDSNGVMQEPIEAWPNLTAADNPTQNDFSISNQISNAQFTQTFLNNNGTTVYNVTGASNQVFAFAPNWDFVISGTGSVTVQQISIPGNDKIITSPPYVLDVTLSSGITSCHLRQRFSKNSGLWASTATQSIFLSGSLIAINQLAGTTGIEMFYVESSGGSPISILQGTIDNSGYKLLNGVTGSAIPLSTNTDVGNSGYIDIYIAFLANSHVRISSIQVVPTLNQAGGNLIPFELNSSNREQAFMGDYYIPNLNARPQQSLLTAWDFTSNPFQFGASGAIGTTAAYICDQTIALRGVTGAVNYAVDTVTNGLKLTTTGNNDAFYLMQYLSGKDAKKILGNPLSVNVFGYVSSTSNPVTMRVYLFRAPSTSVIPTLPISIGTVAANGVFTLTAAGWTEISRSGLNTATAIMPKITVNSDINNSNNDMSFTGWDLTDSAQIADTNYFAMVVTFGYIDTSTVMTINSISLLPNAIPARPIPKSSEEVIRECEYYYEKTYDQGVYAGASSGNGAIASPQLGLPNGGQLDAHPLFISVRYEVSKRIPVTPSVYAINGTTGNLSILFLQDNNNLGTINSPVTNWTFLNLGDTGFSLNPVDIGTVLGSEPFNNTRPNTIQTVAQFHFVADARLGIV